MGSKFEENSVWELAKATVNKAFEKKRTRVITALITFSVTLLCVRALHSGWYVMENTWFSYVLTILFFAAMIMCIAVLVSNIGSFRKWKYITGAFTAAVLMLGLVTFLASYTTLYVSSVEELPNLVSELLYYLAPMFLIALSIVLLIGMLFSYRKKQV